MSSEPNFRFLLPHLLEEGLIEDDSDEYALCYYPRDVVSSSAIILVTDYGRSIDAINLKTKKRRKIVMENLAVSLSLKIKFCAVIDIAIKIYRGWLEHPEIFGTPESQNKYIRRIFKQLSLPFAMNQPTNQEHFQTSFYPILLGIFNVYKEALLSKGSLYEPETIKVLIHVLLGITDVLINFDFSQYLTPDQAATLCESSIDTLFTTIEASGNNSTSLFDKVTNYTKKWSKFIYLTNIWGKHIQTIFSYLLSRLYKASTSESIFDRGVFSVNSPPPISYINYIFQRLLTCFDQSFIFQSPPLLLSFTKTLSAVVKIALDSTLLYKVQSISPSQKPISDHSDNTSIDSGNELLLPRYPLSLFLKMFGPFLNLISKTVDLPAEFHEGIASFVTLLMEIIAKFEFNPSSSAVIKLLALALLTVDENHPLSTRAFFQSAASLYSHNSLILPFVAKTTFKALSWANEAALQNSVSFFCAYEYYTVNTSQDEILQFYQTLFKINSDSLDPHEFFSTICNAPRLGISIIQQVSLFFSAHPFDDSLDKDLIVGLIAAMGVSLRTSSQASKEMVKFRIISLLLDPFLKNSINLEGAARLVIAVLALLIDCITWGGEVISEHSALDSIFQFIGNLQRAMRHRSKTDTPFWWEKQRHCLQALISTFVSKFSTRWVSPDFYTRQLGCGEAASENTLNVNKSPVYYFTAGKEIPLLFSFIDNPQEPFSTLIVRGSFGKSIWKISSDPGSEAITYSTFDNSILWQAPGKTIVDTLARPRTRLKSLTPGSLPQISKPGKSESINLDKISNLKAIPRVKVASIPSSKKVELKSENTEEESSLDGSSSEKDEEEEKKEIENGNEEEEEIKPRKEKNKPTRYSATRISKFSLPSTTTLSEEQKEHLRTIKEENGKFALVDVLPFDKLEKSDIAFRELYHDMFFTWLEWRNGIIDEKRRENCRPSICDFLSDMGLIDPGNTLPIIPHTKEEVNPIIQRFDALDTLPLQPCIIFHVLGNDKSLGYKTELYQRNTTLILDFLRAIGEPFSVNMAQNGINENLRSTRSGKEGLQRTRSRRKNTKDLIELDSVSDFTEFDKIKNVPELRTTAPAITGICSQIVFLTPAMAKTEDGAKEIYEMGSSVPVKIIFNESDFDLNVPLQKTFQTILIVKPSIRGLYHVTELQSHKKIISPFAKEQIMPAPLLAQMVANIYEQLVRFTYKRVLTDNAKNRLDILKDLTRAEPNANLCGELATTF